MLTFHSSDVEYVWATIKEALLNVIHLFIPELKIKPNAFPRWFTSSLKHKTKCLRTLRKRYSRSPTFHVKARLQAIEIEVAEETAAAHSAYESRLINGFANCNQSKIFSYIRSLILFQSQCFTMITVHLMISRKQRFLIITFTLYSHLLAMTSPLLINL